MKKGHIIGILLIAIAIGAILSTVSESSTYASFSMASQHDGKEFHIVGKVDKSKDMSYNPQQNPNLFTFYLTDNEGAEKKVLYNGSKPNDFELSEQIVIIGKMSGDEFHASGILLKCPSKYKEKTSAITEAVNTK